ncbi:hypothetical protein FYJ45_24985 [Eisenbergiella tayi]|uniref:Phage protein n=1 Tax=Eisenbergiella porci TaxID=2652274 RepID=A0A6N7WPP3_9FIRM|nr:hypothetical protein [Eisenbergiella porci]MSS91370.1 hypothetical protein [Eisenbergiella porci]
MTGYGDLIWELNSLLKKKYPDVKIYGNDTTEGWRKPYFFLECVPYGMNYVSRNFIKKSCSLKITYFQRVPDEPDQLQKVEEIREMIGMKFCVKDRKLDIKEYTHDYVGEYNNILQITLDLEWFENCYKEPEEEKMKEIELSVKERRK